MDKVLVTVVEPIDHDQKKHGAVQWQFVNHTLGYPDLRTLENNGIDVYVETECIDERSAPQTILTGKVRLEYNIPGGGFDYLTKEDLQKILNISRGDIVLDPHLACGWGSLRFDFYQRSHGVEYIKNLVARTFRENNFVNSVARIPKFSGRFGFKTDYDNLIQRVFRASGKIAITDLPDQEILGLAFVYAKLNELKQIFGTVAEDLGIYGAVVRLNPDMLFDQPHSHVARGALLNLTQRRFTSRFVVEGGADGTFFADVDQDRLAMILDLIITIMESEHSGTKNADHDIYLMVPGEQVAPVLKIINRYKKSHPNLKTYKHIYIYTVENDESPKSRQDLLNLVR